MGFVLNRRHLLKMSASVPLAWALPGADRAWSQSDADDAAGVIDVHCHVFNASDVPVRGFVQRIVLGDAEDQVVFDPEPGRARAVVPWVGAVLVRMMTSGAPTAAKELSDIEAAGRARVRSRRDPTSPASVQQVADALRVVLSGERPPGSFQPRTRRSDDGRGLLISKIAEEIGASPSGLRGKRRSELDYYGMARGLLSGKGPLSHHIRFAQLLTGDRRDLVAELVTVYGGEGKVLLFTPALIDFSGWLGDAPRSDLESQIRVMERIQRMDLGVHLHCFVAFDPWRQVEDLEAGRSPTAFDLVKSAIEEMGFVGVKLYPPMGFLPTGNVRSGLSYPERAAAIPDFPSKLDAALDTLYAWAAEEGVAVMAHATNSQGAAEGYALRARPDRWAPVLAKYPALRLNLGHFGGFDEAGDGNALNKTWEYMLGRLNQGGASNVFADMSYLNEALPEGTTTAQLAALLGHLRAFLQRYDPNCERLMYGSDWAMLMVEANYGDYLESFRSYVAELGLSESARSRLYRDNAVRFLGLGENAPTRRRLEAYHAKQGLDPAWLSQFVQA